MDDVARKVEKIKRARESGASAEDLREQMWEDELEQKLAAARKMLGLRVLRIFLHTLAFEHVGAATHAEYVQRFLAIAEKHGMGVGIVAYLGGGAPLVAYVGPIIPCPTAFRDLGFAVRERDPLAPTNH